MFTSEIGRMMKITLLIELLDEYIHGYKRKRLRLTTQYCVFIIIFFFGYIVLSGMEGWGRRCGISTV